MAQIDPSSCNAPPRMPRGPTRPRNADATTMVGNTNGTVMAARNNDLPLNWNRAKTYEPGSANSNVSTVDSAACHNVNHSTRRVVSDPSTSLTAPRSHEPSGCNPRSTMWLTGHTKKTTMNAVGTATSAMRPTLLIGAPRSSEHGRRPVVDPLLTVGGDLVLREIDGV